MHENDEVVTLANQFCRKHRLDTKIMERILVLKLNSHIRDYYKQRGM